MKHEGDYVKVVKKYLGEKDQNVTCQGYFSYEGREHTTT